MAFRKINDDEPWTPSASRCFMATRANASACGLERTENGLFFGKSSPETNPIFPRNIGFSGENVPLNQYIEIGIWLIWLKYEPYLVGGLEPWNFMTFHGNSNPNWRNPSFFRGVGTPPTRIWLKHEPYIGWHNVEIGLKDSHHYVQNVARMTAWPLVAIRTVICLWTCLRLSSCCFSGLPIFFV